MHRQRRDRGESLITEYEQCILDNPPHDGVGLLPLGKGRFAIVDEKNYSRLVQYKWNLSHRNNVCRMERGKYVSLHRFIMNASPGTEVDHINHNRLDNREVNLRICTKSQNQMNSRKRANRSSRFKGVSWNSKAKKWHARLAKENAKYFLGVYESEEDAAIAYNVAAQLFFGRYALLNDV